MLTNHGSLQGTYEISAKVNGKPSWSSISYYAIWYCEGKWLIGKRDDIGTTVGQIYNSNIYETLNWDETSTRVNGKPSWTFSYAIWYCEDKWLIGERGDIGTKFGQICFKGSLLGPDKTDVLVYEKGRFYGQGVTSTANDISIECIAEKG